MPSFWFFFFPIAFASSDLHDLLASLHTDITQLLAGFTQENPDTERRSQSGAKWQPCTSGNGTKVGQAWKTYTLKTVGSIHTFYFIND